MKNYTATNIMIGDLFESVSGVTLKITNIEIAGLHFEWRSPRVNITYEWSQWSDGGIETVSLSNFKKNLKG